MARPNQPAGYVVDGELVEDAELIKRLRVGDEPSFLALVERLHAPLMRLARSLVPSDAVAEEVVQETWVAVIQGLDRFEGRSALKTWIFRILSNRAKTRGVRERRTIPESALGDDGDDFDAVDANRFDDKGMWGIAPRRWEDDTPERLSMNRQAIACLNEALATLPASQRAVVTLRDVEGLESEDVCNILEISETNQRVLLHRGRSKLRAALEEYFERE